MQLQVRHIRVPYMFYAKRSALHSPLLFLLRRRPDRSLDSNGKNVCPLIFGTLAVDLETSAGQKPDSKRVEQRLSTTRLLLHQASAPASFLLYVDDATGMRRNRRKGYQIRVQPIPAQSATLVSELGLFSLARDTVHAAETSGVLSLAGCIETKP